MTPVEELPDQCPKLKVQSGWRELWRPEEYRFTAQQLHYQTLFVLESEHGENRTIT